MKKYFCLLLFLSAATFAGTANTENKSFYRQQLPWVENYDESAMPPYQLPALLRCQNGEEITSIQRWETLRRPELLKLFKKFMYGPIPPLPDAVNCKILNTRSYASGLALRQEIEITFSMKNDRRHSFIMLLYIPVKRSPCPAFIGLTFHGNHVAESDPSIQLTGLTLDRSPEFRKKTEKMRGAQSRRFPLKEILSRGYAIAFASYHDVFPDRANGWKDSIYQLFFSQEELARRPEKYSAIGAWSWAISRMADYLSSRPEIDPEKLAVFGHSRLGKTSLWTGVCDQRFKLVCVNNSGCGGAALSRRLFGETLFSMCFNNRKVGRWWFTDSLPQFALTPENLPIDQHQLLALVAPRKLCIHSATLDQWADPKGEYLSLYNAGKVFALYGLKPLSSPEMPPADTPIGSDVSYMIRTGKHDILLSDWKHYLDIADRTFKDQ